MKTDFFFVYGTLKEGGVFSKRFDKLRVNSEKATINNMTLYKIGWFPGIIPGNDTVIGELHEYKEPDIVMQNMDRIEGYINHVEQNSAQNLFIRERKIVITKSGKKVKSIVYIFNYETNGMNHIKPIKSGIWVNRNKI